MTRRFTLALRVLCPDIQNMQIDLTDTPLKRAELRDWKTVADITGEAFADDPTNQ